MPPLPTPAEAPLDTTTPPFIELQDDEVVLHCHVVEYSERLGLAWLTSHRLLLRADRATPALQARRNKATTEEERAACDKTEQFQLPLANIEGFKVSVVNNAASKVMLQLSYISRESVVLKVVLRFAGPTALQDRTAWQAVLSELTLAKLPHVQVKPEPGTEQQAAASPVAVAAPAVPKPAAAAPAASAAAVASKPTAPPRVGMTGAKRGHSQISAGAGGSAASASSAAGASTAAPAAAPAALSASELEAVIKSRAALLARDSALKELHTDLVPSAVSEEEFWSTPQRVALLREEQARQNLPDVGSGSGGTGGGGGGSASSSRQRVGLSSRMGSIKTETGCNVVHYTLDAASIHAIFLEFPMVHELFKELVPTKMNDKEFWTRYLKNRYVHSQQSAGAAARNNSGAVAVDDIFGRAKAMQDARNNELARRAQQQHHMSDDPVAAAEQAAREADERDLSTKARLLAQHVDPSVDLSAADAPDAVTGAGGLFVRSAAGAATPTSSGGGEPPRSSKELKLQKIMQLYNRHGCLVMDPASSAAGATVLNNSAASAAKSSVVEQAEQKLQQAYHAGLSKELELVDLSREVVPVYNELHIHGQANGSGSGPRSTAGGAAGVVRGGIFAPRGAVTSTATPAQIAAASAQLRTEMANWDCVQVDSVETKKQQQQQQQPHHRLAHLPSSDLALQLVTSLTATARGMNKAAVATRQLREGSGSNGDDRAPGGSGALLVFSTDGVTSDTLIPAQFSAELKKRYATCAELFRHFWSSLSPRTADKLRRVKQALDEQHALLQLIRKSLHERQFSALVPVLGPLIAQIAQCDKTFRAWEDKEARRLASLQQQAAAKRNANANANASKAASAVMAAAAAAAAAASPASSPTSSPSSAAAEDAPEAKRARVL